MKRKIHHADTLLAIGIIGLVLLLVIPLPPLLLDLFLAFNLALSVMALLLTFYVENALDFSAFPSLLLFLTLYRLGLNIASTRMILTHGEGGDIIHTFGNFVTEGHVGVGIILFSLLTLINFIVVTKGAGRVAEVAARFTLEALGGKQVAIDGEQVQGLLTQKQAKEQRRVLIQETEFYGAMDGASKFVRGDAIASLVITFVNIIGGLFVGFCLKGLSFFECIDIYTRLTVGDGLVSQIPALLVSIGSGIIVTRASRGSLGRAFVTQFIGHPKVFFVTGLLLLILSFIPGMPLLILFPVSLLFLGFSLFLFRHTEEPSSFENKPLLLELKLGVKAISYMHLVKEEVAIMRKNIEKKLGVVLPPLSIVDSASLRPSTYALFLQGERISEEKTLEPGLFAKELEESMSKHAFEFVGRNEALALIEKVRLYDASLVEEMKLPLPLLIKLLQSLLKERVPIKDATLIMETLVENGTGEGEELLRIVREKLGRRITEQYFGEKRIAHVITLDPKVEQMLQVSLSFHSQERIRPKTIDNITSELKKIMGPSQKLGITPVILTHRATRSRLKSLIEKSLPNIPVLSYGELTADVTLETLGMITPEVLI